MTRHDLRFGGRRGNRALAVISLLAAAVPGLANAQPQSPNCRAVRSYLASAQKALATRDSAAAFERLNRAIEVDSKCADTYLLLGLAEFQRGNVTKSMEYYKQALKLAPRSYSAHYNLALAYLKEKNLDDARSELEQAVPLDPKQADAAYDLGIVLLDLGQPAAALPHLRHAYTINPERPDVSFNIVRAQLETGDPSGARNAAQDAESHLGSDFQWNAAVGQLFLKHAQAADAAVYFRTANLIRPGDQDIRDQLASAYLASGQSQNVWDLVKDPKTADDHYLRGSAFYQAHRFSEADEESAAALELAPENPKILVLRVRLLQRAGEQNAALELAQKAITLAPDWYEPFYLAGISYYFVRHYPQAQQSLARAFELNPSSAATVFVEALAWANEGNRQEAERCLRQAISLQPDNARFHCHLGILFLRQNKSAEAEGSFKKAIQLKPEYALSHYELGKLRMNAKQWKDASDELESAIKFDPGLTSAYYQLGIAYARLGETEKSEHMLAEFKKLHQQDTDDSAIAEEDARKESDAR